MDRLGSGLGGGLRFSVAQQHDTSAPAALQLSPFRAMRYNDAVVGDVSEVTSPPYDVMDRTMIDEMLRANPRNIVRLILPLMVCDPLTTEDPYARAASRLQRWRKQQALVTDAVPALYVYEYGDDSGGVCGLVGAADLRERSERVILPHEDVIDSVVVDRLAMMTASRANLEPILLVYDGAGVTAPLIDSSRALDPLIHISAPDGSYHRVWAMSDPDAVRAVNEHLRPRQALIADGHHRYATYLRMQQRRRLAGDVQAAGPWDRGLALLIDQAQWPLRLGAIHRTVADLTWDALVAPPGFELTELEAGAQVAEVPPGSAREVVITDGQRSVRLSWSSRHDGTTSDTEVLHDVVFPAWAVEPDRIGYHHDVDQTLVEVAIEGGLAVLLHPATVAEVMEVAGTGRILPRKSTSFGPKPRMGLLMRNFDDEGDLE